MMANEAVMSQDGWGVARVRRAGRQAGRRDTYTTGIAPYNPEIAGERVALTWERGWCTKGGVGKVGWF
jgi:hypothetical protein